jgi:tetratricopeptide (TPR) repeat protein
MVVHERRDHRIAVPRPDLSATLGTPNACAACHEERGNAWAADVIARHRSGRRLGPSAAEQLGPVLWSARHDQEGATAAARAFLDDPTVGGLAKATVLSALRAVGSDEAAVVSRPFLKVADPWLRLGAIEALRGVAEGAGSPSGATLADDPSRAVRLALASAVVQAERGGFAAAPSADLRTLLGEYEGWLTANADRAEALAEKATLRRAEGDHQAARATFERALRRDETSLVATLSFAAFLLGEGDEGSAETLLRRACDLEPASAEAHFALGMALIRRKQVGAGVRELGKATELAPDNGPYAYAYAVGLHAMAEDERALVTLGSARRRFPGNVQIEAALRALCETRHQDPRCFR